MVEKIDVKTPLIIVTGLSGSGKTTALKTLEDLGCEVIDNLPISLCPLLMQEKQRTGPIALGIDVRTRDFEPSNFTQCIHHFRTHSNLDTCVLFFEADPFALENRYRESRRHHPLGVNAPLTLLVQKEQGLLAQIRHCADEVINTTSLSPPELKGYLQNKFNLFSGEKPSIYILSFAYRRGVPYSADFVFDMRFLPNPYYQKEMKLLTGKSTEVMEYLKKQPPFQTFMKAFEEMVPGLAFSEKRPAFVLAFGCTGGRHRSVVAAEYAANLLENRGYTCHISHRDIV